MASVKASPVKSTAPATGVVNDNDTFLLLKEVEEVVGNNPARAIELLVKFVHSPIVSPEKENAIIRAGELIKQSGDVRALDEYVRSLEGCWKVLPRAKTARLVRVLLEQFDGLAAAANKEQLITIKQVQMKLCSDLVAWTVRDKRAFLKQALELRLASLYLDNKMYSEAIALVSLLLGELKRMDDKLTLVEVHLLECKIYFALRNGPKAKAALTAARSNANSIYCPPLVQAALDMQSAMVHADEGDFKTAYSYFIEALDSYASQNDPRGARALKYMMLCKIMLMSSHDRKAFTPSNNNNSTIIVEQEDELDAIIKGKLGSKYSLGDEVEAMKAIAEAHRNKSLKQFETALATFPDHLGTDPLIHAHFQGLYDQLLQQNLLSIIQPYSRVQLLHISKQIELPVDVVEGKLSMMVLDKQLSAIIDQNEQCLVITEQVEYDRSFIFALETIRHLDSAIDALYQKATTVV